MSVLDKKQAVTFLPVSLWRCAAPWHFEQRGAFWIALSCRYHCDSAENGSKHQIFCETCKTYILTLVARSQGCVRKYGQWCKQNYQALWKTAADTSWEASHTAREGKIFWSQMGRKQSEFFSVTWHRVNTDTTLSLMKNSTYKPKIAFFLTRHTYWLCGPGEKVLERMMVLPLTNWAWGGFAALLSFGRTTVEDCARLSVFVSLSTWKTDTAV